MEVSRHATAGLSGITEAVDPYLKVYYP